MSVDRRTFLASALAATLYGSSGSHAEQSSTEDQVLELRQYTLHRGQRETLISLFESTFIDSQNAHGVHVLGTFCDLEDPDRFVWIRGFKDMNSRPRALAEFYKDPVWVSNRRAVAVTTLDTDNVLLLRPAAAGQGLKAEVRPRTTSESVVTVSLYYLGGVESSLFRQFFDQVVMPELAGAGVRPIARLVTEDTPNNFPRLPIREHEHVFGWVGRWESRAAADATWPRRTCCPL